MKRTMTRRRMPLRIYKGREILRSTLLLCVLAFLIRILLFAGVSEKIDGLLKNAASNDAFIETALNFELGSPRIFSAVSVSGWQDIITSESAVMAAKFTTEDMPYTPPEDSENSMPAQDTQASPVPSEKPVPQEEFDPSQPEPLTINPLSPEGYDYADGVYIKNETDFNIDVREYLDAKPEIKLDSEGAQVLIVHTHASEAFMPDSEYPYTPTDNDRTEDTNLNVVRLGDEITKIFEEKGIRVIHDRGIYDYPTYNGSYTRTLEVIESYLKKNPGIKIVLDIHRDALIKEDGSVYKTVTTIDGESTAQIMLLLGTSQGGLSHPDWKENLKLGIRLQKSLSDKYPTLARPLNLKKERYNMHATKGSVLVEIGSSGNTLGEAIRAARLFAETAAVVFLELCE